MATVNLELIPREGRGSKKADGLRKQGMIPGVIYSGGGEATQFTVLSSHFIHEAKGKPRNTVYKVKSSSKDLDGLEVVVRDVQVEPIKKQLLHIDLIKLSKGLPVVVGVPLDIVGEVDTVEQGLALIQQSVYSVKVKCKPEEIPASVELDVTGLEPGQGKLAGTITLPEGVNLVTSKATAVVSIIAKSKKAASETTDDAPAAEAAASPASA